MGDAGILVYIRSGQPFTLRWPHYILPLIIWPQNSASDSLLRSKSHLDLFSTAIRAIISLLNIIVFQKKGLQLQPVAINRVSTCSMNVKRAI